jgi:hypothetical protein
MTTINQYVFDALGEGVINQNIVDALAEIMVATSPKETVKAVSKFKNYALIAARGLEMKQVRA